PARRARGRASAVSVPSRGGIDRDRNTSIAGQLTAMSLERDIVIRVADFVGVDPRTGRLSIDGAVTAVVVRTGRRPLGDKMVKRLVGELPERPYNIDAVVDFAPDGLPRVVLRLRTS